MRHFLALLEDHRASPAPPPELVHLAGSLCQELQNSPVLVLAPLVKGVLDSPHWQYFLSNLGVIRVCTLVLACQGQHQEACRLLEHCRETEDREQLIQLWNEIHYHKIMEKYHVDSLTPIQKFRCRKRNPPPVSLCPEGLKNRNFSKDVRQKLLSFAVGVTMNPNREQRERLAFEMGLQVHQIYNWFANYRRRQRLSLQRQGQHEGGEPVPETQPSLDPGPCNLQPEAGFQGNVHLGAPKAPLGPCELAWEPPILDLKCPQEEGLTKPLDGRFMGSSEMQGEKLGPDPQNLLLTAGPNFPMEGPGTSIYPPASTSRPEPMLSALGPWPENFFLDPCESLPGQVPDAAYGSELQPVPGTSQEPVPLEPFSDFWDPQLSDYHAPLDRSPPRAAMGPRPDMGSFKLREEPLGPLECTLPQSSEEMVLEKPSSSCQVPCLGEPQALEYGQSPLARAGDPGAALGGPDVTEEVATASVWMSIAAFREEGAPQGLLVSLPFCPREQGWTGFLHEGTAGTTPSWVEEESLGLGPGQPLQGSAPESPPPASWSAPRRVTPGEGARGDGVLQGPRLQTGIGLRGGDWKTTDEGFWREAGGPDFYTGLCHRLGDPESHCPLNHFLFSKSRGHASQNPSFLLQWCGLEAHSSLGVSGGLAYLGRALRLSAGEAAFFPGQARTLDLWKKEPSENSFTGLVQEQMGLGILVVSSLSLEDWFGLLRRDSAEAFRGPILQGEKQRPDDIPTAIECRPDCGMFRLEGMACIIGQMKRASVPGDSLNEQDFSDTFWAALLLFEFSGGNRI
ncbi:anomalous homeobox protein [Macrotis lagotis]|uniref:anomalous homeobox protein n=1 Tax=Macrotis lagotis TaxID=92651 RepID=UPI003D6974BD